MYLLCVSLHCMNLIMKWIFASKRAGYTQKELALLTDIPIRTLQQYEQRQKNINKASGEYLYAISKVLGCEIKELMEV